MSFEITREGMLEILEKLHKHKICAYMGSVPCDCKYGGHDIGKGCGESNGCPEIRGFITFLRFMTDEEYLIIQERIQEHIKENAKKNV